MLIGGLAGLGLAVYMIFYLENGLANVGIAGLGIRVIGLSVNGRQFSEIRDKSEVISQG